VERAEQEVVARRARRLLWGFRLVFYAGAAVAAALLLADGGDEPEVAFLDGRTSQGHVFELMLRDGRPAYLSTGFDAPCQGSPWQTGWQERDGDGVRFRIEDGRLAIDTSWPARFDEPGFSGRHTVKLRAELEDRLRGTMRLHGVMRTPAGSTYTCESGDVTFLAG
jgi:hypothetical protein